jgi:hypothetical protein
METSAPALLPAGKAASALAAFSVGLNLRVDEERERRSCGERGLPCRHGRTWRQAIAERSGRVFVEHRTNW